MTGEKWMTSGRARLKARQNRTFAQRASLGRTRNRANRAVEPSSAAKRHPSYNKQNTTGLTGTYSAWADPIARRAVVAMVGNDTSRSENEVNAEYPPGTVVASDRPPRKIRDASRWNTIPRPSARYTSGIASSYHQGHSMHQQREVSPPFAYGQGPHAPMGGPPVLQQHYHDPTNGFANHMEYPHYYSQHRHHQYIPYAHKEMYAGEQDRYASPHDQPHFGTGNYSTPGFLQRKAYYQSHSFESAWGEGLVPPPAAPEQQQQQQQPVLGHSSVPPQWHQGHPFEDGRGGFARFQKPLRSLNLEREVTTEYGVQMDYQQYDNNDFFSPPLNYGFHDGEPFSVEEGHSNVYAPFAMQNSPGNVPPFSVQNGPFSLQNSQTGIPPFAPKQVHRGTPFNSPSLTQNGRLDHNQGEFDDFDELPSNPTRPLQPEYPVGHRNSFGFPSDHHRRHMSMVGNTGEPFVSPETEFGIPSEQNERPPFQQTRQRQFLSAHEEPNVLDDFAPFDEALQRNDEAATRGIPIFKGRRSASRPDQAAVEQYAKQRAVPLKVHQTIPSREQEGNFETNVANEERAKNNKVARGAEAKQKLPKKDPEKKMDSGSEPVEFFQAWKGAQLDSSDQANLSQPNPQNRGSMTSASVAEDKRPNNKAGSTEKQNSLQNHRGNNLERVDVAGEKEDCHQRRAESDDDSVDDGRRPYGSRLPLRFFNEGIEIDVRGRPLVQNRSSTEEAATTTKTGNPGFGSPNSDSLDGVEWNEKRSLWA